MIHARSDYNRIQDPALFDPSLLSPGSTPIGKNEPVFLIRARDADAPAVVREWAEKNYERTGDETLYYHVMDWANQMEEWQTFYGCKPADAPEGVLGR